jgi:TM2 domain-containing membrane protein YozV
MKRCAVVLIVIVCGHGDAHATAVDASQWVSPLALPRVEGGDEPELILAQRAIEREWPAPGDSDVTLMTDGKSEVAAMIFSAVAPGTGQVYTGRPWSGVAFAAVEVLGWLGWHRTRESADDLRQEARQFAGTPTDTASAWSFARYEQSHGEDLVLRALYAKDPDAFDEAIANDPQYAPGWAATHDQAEFRDLRDRSDTRLTQSRIAESGLWINHVVAALDALRLARVHNRSLGYGLELKAKGGWQHGRPEMMVTLLRRF